MNAMTRDQEAIYDTTQARWQKAPACLGVCNLLVGILLLLRHVDNLATFRRSTQALVRIRRYICKLQLGDLTHSPAVLWAPTG
jgi:hypothetical protein